MTAKTTAPVGIKAVLSQMVLTPKSNLAVRSKINKGLEKLDSDDFFGFENMSSQLQELQTATARDRITAEMAELGFPELDYSFLAWYRDRTKKLPAFMVLNLDTNEFRITVESLGGNIFDLSNIEYGFDPTLPEAIWRKYEESLLYLGKLSNEKYDDDEIAITAQFHGVMPLDVRRKTQKVLDDEIFDEIFIICEAPTWAINKTGRTDKKDPLVVGWVDETDQMFLIASFDITSLEDYVLTQFKK